MRKIIMILFLLLPCLVFGQGHKLIKQGNPDSTQQDLFYGMVAPGQLRIPSTFRLSHYWNDTNSLAYVDGSLYRFDGSSWQVITSGGGAGVTSFNGRTGIVVPGYSDYTTTQVAEGTNLYWTNARFDTRFTSSIANYYTQTQVDNLLALKLSIASAALTYVPITDLSTSADANKVIQRTSDANAYANNFVPNTATITASGTTRVLTAASARTQQVTGTGNQVYQLPVATSLAAGFPFEFDNNATGTVTVNNSAGTTLFTIPSGGYTVVKLMVVGGGGTWDFHSTIPANSTWGTAGVDVTGAVTATGAVTGSNLSGNNTGDQTNITGNAATVTTNANLTGPVTSVGNATAITATGVSAGSYTYTALTVNAAGQITAASSGSAPTGTVTAVSIATANGFAGSSSGGATPVLTMSVTPTSGSILKSTTGGAITAAVAGTDYQAAGSYQPQLNGTGFVKATGTTISYDNSTYITQNQTISDVGNGDVTWSTSGTNTLTKTTAIKSSVALAGSPTTTTQSAADNSTKIATTAYVDRLAPADTTISAAYTLTSRDANRSIHCTNSSNIALTIPTGLATTFRCEVIQEAAGTVTPTASSTTLTFIPTGTTKTKQAGSAMIIRSWATANSFTIQGDLQ